MKHFILSLLSLAFVGQLVAQYKTEVHYAQKMSESKAKHGLKKSLEGNTGDCEGAIVLCGGVYTEKTAPPGTGNVYEFTGGCNQGTETMSLWYTFTAQEAGTISFVIDPADDLDDYDWGLFDITNGGCAGIIAQDGSSPEVGCNSYGSFTSNGPTGISTANGGTGTASTTFTNLTTNVTGTLPVANGGTGAATLTVNNVVLGNGTSAVQFVAPGTSGNVLTSTGSTWTSSPGFSTGKAIAMAIVFGG